MLGSGLSPFRGSAMRVMKSIERRRRHRRAVNTLSCTASENTAPVPFESAYAIWTSWQHSCDRDDQALMQRGDRVGNVTLGPDRRRRGVGNYREWQVF